MLYKILADVVLVVHFMWILFMVGGVMFTIACFFRKQLFDKWLIRTIHLAGIIFVCALAVMEKYCPLTILENKLRLRYNPEGVYPESFIQYYLEKLIYPDVDPAFIVMPTIILTLFTVVVFIIKPPQKIRNLFLSKTI